MTKTGRCLCGACVFELTGPHNWTGHCYCESCRKATASAFTTWIGHPDGQWQWLGASPASYQSSPGRTRGFCTTCGTPMFYRAEDWPDETHFYAALLDEAATLKIEEEYHCDEALAWAPPRGIIAL